jgi:hypothetical protein
MRGDLDSLIRGGSGHERPWRVKERDRMARVISVFNGDNGVSKVEISTDDGKTWKQAEIDQPGIDISWSLWRYRPL